TCRRRTLSCWRRTRISATSFVLGLKSEAMTWGISRRNAIIKWQGYRVSASRLAESNFRYTQVRFQAGADAFLVGGAPRTWSHRRWRCAGGTTGTGEISVG